VLVVHQYQVIIVPRPWHTHVFVYLAIPATMATLKSYLAELMEAKQEGLITEKEFKQAKKDIIAKFVNAPEATSHAAAATAAATAAPGPAPLGRLLALVAFLVAAAVQRPAHLGSVVAFARSYGLPLSLGWLIQEENSGGRGGGSGSWAALSSLRSARDRWRSRLRTPRRIPRA